MHTAAKGSLPNKPRFSPLRAFFWPIYGYELKKVLPMFSLFFLISFIFNILRCMKISVMVSAEGASAEVVPFLKFCAVLPASFLMIYFFTKLSNRYSREHVFYIIISFFLGFTQADFDFKFDPYVGVGASMVNMKGANSQTVNSRKIEPLSNFQKKNYYTLDGFIGANFHEYFGIELGYQHSANKKKNVNGNVLNEPTTGAISISNPHIETEISFRNIYADLNGYFPIDQCWCLNASLGIAHVAPIVKYRQANRPPAGTVYNSLVSTVYSKNVLKAGLGVIYKLNEKTGIRAKANYLNTKRLKADFNNAAPQPNEFFTDIKLFKNTYMFSIAVFTQL